MITATMQKRDGRFVSYEISGHAESGDYGHDLVCASVTTLAMTTGDNIWRLAKVKPLVEKDNGYLKVELPLTLPKRSEETAQLLLEALENSLEMLTTDQHDFITFKTEEGNKK